MKPEWEVTANGVPVAWFVHDSDAKMFIRAVEPEYPDSVFKLRKFPKRLIGEGG